jgi:serine/threonine protein phosphatase PrpC
MHTHDTSGGACRWRVVAASVCGTSHQKVGKPCQDVQHWSVAPGGVLVATVADGAGSASLGEVGATIAAWTAAATVSTPQHRTRWPDGVEAWRACLTQAISTARAAVEVAAEIRQVSPRELATTLILVVATSSLVAMMQVGDGAVVVGDGDGNLISLTVPQGGEYANETTFLVSPNALAAAQFCLWHGTPAYLAAFSDGLQRLALKMPEGMPYAPFFRPLFQFMARVTHVYEAQAQIEAFLRSPRISERTDDDATLVLATLVR